VQQSHSLQAELQKNVTDRAQKYWKLGTDQSAALVTVELQDLLLSSKRDEHINCAIRVLVSVQRGVAKDSKTTEQKMYQYVAPTSSLSIWLDESNDFIDTVLTNASQQIATQIVSDLASNGDVIRLAGSRRDPKLNLVLSSDGKSFEGSIEEATGIKRISGIKVE
jgi:hypothetical protein